MDARTTARIKYGWRITYILTAIAVLTWLPLCRYSPVIAEFSGFNLADPSWSSALPFAWMFMCVPGFLGILISGWFLELFVGTINQYRVNRR